MRRRAWIAVTALLALPFAFRAIFGRPETGVRPMPAAPAAARDVYGDPLPPFAIARIGSIRFRGAAFGLGWTDGGAALVSCGADGVVRVFDAETGLVRREFVAHRGVVEPGGSATSTPDAMLHVLKGTVFQPVHDLPIAAAVSRDGTRIVTAGPAAVSVWDVASGARVSTWRGSSQNATELSISDDGRMVANAGWNGSIDVRDAQTGHRVRLVRKRSESQSECRARSLSLSADGALLAYATDAVHVVGTVSGNDVVSTPSEDDCGNVALSPRGDALVHGTSGDRVSVDGWVCNPLSFRDPATLEIRRKTSAIAEGAWGPLAFRHDGGVVAVGGRSVSLVDPVTGATLRRVRVAPAEVESIAWSPDGRRIAAICDRVVRVWDATTGAEEHTEFAPGASVKSVALTADGRTVAVGRVASTVDLFDASTGALLRTVGEIDRKSVWFFAWISGDRVVTLASTGAVPTVRSWRLADGSPSATRTIDLRQHGFNWSVPLAVERLGGGRVQLVDLEIGAVVASLSNIDDNMALTITPDRRFVVGTDPQVHVWSAASGRLVVSSALPERSGGWSIPEFSADSQSMAYAQGQHVSVLDVATGETTGGFDAPEHDYANPLALSPDGRIGATGGADGSIVLHDVATGDLVATLPGHRAPPSRLVFSADGRTLVSSADTILVWDVSAWTSK